MILDMNKQYFFYSNIYSPISFTCLPTLRLIIADMTCLVVHNDPGLSGAIPPARYRHDHARARPTNRGEGRQLHFNLPTRTGH